MRKRLQSFSLIAITTVFSMICWGSVLQAQDAGAGAQPPSQAQQPSPDAQQPPSQPTQSPDMQKPGQTAGQAKPEASGQSQADPSGASDFVGTVVKQGDKYMFQDAASGTTYDIDHQDQVKKFEGKKVRVHGTIDPSGKMIHVQ